MSIIPGGLKPPERRLCLRLPRHAVGVKPGMREGVDYPPFQRLCVAAMTQPRVYQDMNG